MGIARGFLFLGAAATVVSLWSVDDGSTSTLMAQMYQHLMDVRTTAQALRLAMLHLLHGRAESSRDWWWAQTRLPQKRNRQKPSRERRRRQSAGVKLKKNLLLGG